MKKIIISESQLRRVIDNQINEQTSISTGVQSGTYEPTSGNRTPNWPVIPQEYPCTTPELSMATVYCKNKGVNPFWIKYSIGILGRETDFGKVMGKYGIKAVPEYTMNKLSELIPGFKSLLQYGAKKVFGKDNWVPSMGIAQMTPDIAKKYNVNLEDLMSLSGSLYAVSRYLSDLYTQLSKYYDATQPSKIIYNKQLINNPSTTGNAALDAAIMSYNLGPSKFTVNYCKTNSSEYMAPCQSANGIYQPFPTDNPNFKLTVYKNQVVKNYIPTIKTKTSKNEYISNTGYLKEVVGYTKTLGCIK